MSSPISEKELGEMFQRAGTVCKVEEELTEHLREPIEELGSEYGRDTVVKALQGVNFGLKMRADYNTYDIPQKVFEEIMEILQEYEIEFEVGDISEHAVAERLSQGNPMLACKKCFFDIGDYESAWRSIQRLACEHGEIVYRVFFDMTIYPNHYTDRHRYVEAILQEAHWISDDPSIRTSWG